MSNSTDSQASRREFIGRLGQLGASAAVLGYASPALGAPASGLDLRSSDSSAWDLSWVQRIESATDKAVFDASAMGDGTVLDLATRYLDNCDAVYGAAARKGLVVLNARTRAIAFALNDGAWQKFGLADRYQVKERNTQVPGLPVPATHNPFLEIPANAYPGTGSINSLVKRGAIVLVCDFALGHLATGLAEKAGQPAEEVHKQLLASFVPGAFAVPSGIFGLAKAQNAGCGLVVV